MYYSCGNTVNLNLIRFRFVYSGRLEIQKSNSEMSAIYAAAKKLKVSLLTHVMDHHFPYLFPPCIKK